jgi:hypothetical protein
MSFKAILTLAAIAVTAHAVPTKRSVTCSAGRVTANAAVRLSQTMGTCFDHDIAVCSAASGSPSWMISRSICEHYPVTILLRHVERLAQV